MDWFEASARWYLVLAAATLAVAPWVRLICGGLTDRGATIARPLALLAVVYPTWLLASLGFLPYSTLGLWITLVVVGLGGWGLMLARLSFDATWLRSLLVAEVIALVAFVAFIWLRGFTPDITNTEKPMDAAFLNASVRAEAMPPPDPWFAGEPINYYYLGYVLHGALARMSGTPGAIGFNLALATTFSMTLTAAAGLGFNALRRGFSRRRALAAGGILALLLAVLGNLYAPRRLISDPRGTWNAGWWDGIGWPSSRVVCDDPVPSAACENITINEFPYFSFLLGDLHPHLIALPFTVVALSLALNLMRREAPAGTARRSAFWATLIATGAAIGALYPLNSWDYPTFLVICAAAYWIGQSALEPRAKWLGLAALGGASFIVWLPFIVKYTPPLISDPATLPPALRDIPGIRTVLTTVGAYGGPRTSVSEFLTVFGVGWAISVWFLGTALLRTRPLIVDPALARVVGFTLILSSVVALLLPAPMLLLCGLPLAAAVILLGRVQGPDARTIAIALFGVGHALLLVTEFFYIQDRFSNRMNTVFKVYYQVWTLFAVASALALVILWREAWPRTVARPALMAFFVIIVAAGSVYPTLASYRWTGEFGEWRGLDGTAYLADSLPDEYAALQWLTANAGPDDVILEAAGCSYGTINGMPLNRMSAYSGVPTVIGWGFHEVQWRSGQPEEAQIGQRQQDVAMIYSEQVNVLLQHYDVSLVVIGLPEQIGSPGCNVDGPYTESSPIDFAVPGWERAFESGDARIYRRESPAPSR